MLFKSQPVVGNLLGESSLCDLLGGIFFRRASVVLVVTVEDCWRFLRWLTLLIDENGVGWAILREGGSVLAFECDPVALRATVESLSLLDTVPEQTESVDFLDGYVFNIFKKIDGKSIKIDADCVSDDLPGVRGALSLLFGSERELKRRLAAGAWWRLSRVLWSPGALG